MPAEAWRPAGIVCLIGFKHDRNGDKTGKEFELYFLFVVL
jgi:hypothetical protein